MRRRTWFVTTIAVLAVLIAGALLASEMHFKLNRRLLKQGSRPGPACLVRGPSYRRFRTGGSRTW